MIIDDAAKLEELAGKVIVLRRSQQHSQALAHRTERVHALLGRASNATVSGNAIAARLGEPREPSALLEQALTRIREWRSALDEDLSHALSGELFAGFHDSVEKAVREIERRATAAWQRYVAQTIPDTSDEILSALAADLRARSTVLQIRRLSGTLRRLRERPIPTPDELSEFETGTTELRNAWSTLDVGNLNDEIVTFLRAANSERGAPLGLLTQPVLEWLDQRGATSHYVVRPAER